MNLQETIEKIFETVGAWFYDLLPGDVGISDLLKDFFDTIINAIWPQA